MTAKERLDKRRWRRDGGDDQLWAEQHPDENMREIDRDVVHYWDKTDDLSRRVRCGHFSIRMEFRWTKESVNCLDCLARGPRT